MEEIKPEIKTIEKKKGKITLRKVSIVLLILFVINSFFAYIFIYHLEVENQISYKNDIERLIGKSKSLKEEMGIKKQNLDCTPTEAEGEKEQVEVEIDFYTQFSDPVKVPQICTDCVIREVGSVRYSSSLPKSLEDLKYLVVIIDLEYDDWGRDTQVLRFLADETYTNFYLFEDLGDTDGVTLNKDLKYNIDYSPVLTTSLLPEDLDDVAYFKTDNNLSFTVGYTTSSYDSLLDVKPFDTYKGTKIYVNNENPDSYYIKDKEDFFVFLEFLPSIAVGIGYNEPYPIVWNDKTENTENFDYGYDGCGYYTLRSSNVDKSELKITGKRIGNNEPIYEYLDSENESLKKIYEEDYLEYIYPYDEKDYGKPKLTYEQFVAIHPIIFWEDETGRMIMFYNSRFVAQGGCAKPIVYLYPKQETDITVKVIPTTGYLTFTYPKYNDIWKVSSNKNGIIKDSSGKSYEYLWWESKSDYLPEMKNGFIVKYENLDIFFDLILTNAGFNQKEIKDFKEYWVPTMVSEYTPYFRISFLQNEAVNSIADLVISPTPDTEIRIFMIYDRLFEKESIPTQNILHTKREGFTVTEWGGTRR